MSQHVAEPDGVNLAGFNALATERLRAAQAALTDLLAGAGVGGARPTEVGRQLGLDKTLAWKVSRFVGSSDPSKAVRHMPGAGGVEIVVKAASSVGVNDEILSRAREADRSLRSFVEQHAGDRRSFEAMLAGGGRDERVELEERRSYYRAGSAIWGVRARLQFLMLALMPSSTRPGYLDAVQISGLVDFERLRRDVPWILRRLRAHSDSGAEVFRVVREPLEPARRASSSGQARPPLFEKYCSSPMPELRQFETESGWVCDELAPGLVGREGAATVVLGERYLGPLPLERSADNTAGSYVLTVRTPVECVLFDVLLHESLSHFGAAQRVVYGLLEDRGVTTPTGQSGAGARPKLMDQEPATELGGSAIVQTPRLPAYASMVDDALEIAGFSARSSFRGYRTEIEYPAFPCDIKMSVEIGER